jgi:hypothetical protein
METDELIDAVWTGSLTDVVPPQGWVEDPEDCDSLYDDDDDDEDEEEPLNLDRPGGLCVDDSDCYTRIRGAMPVNSLVGPDLCGCYAASELLPWDQTEGQEHFRRARCMPGACDGYEAYCTRKPDEPGMGISFAMGECALRPIASPSTSVPTEEKDEKSDDEDGNEDDEEKRNLDSPGGVCAFDSDCETRIRGAMPVNSLVGPDLCGCYAGSKVFPWDQTEGQEHFRNARCQGNVCDGYEAYCTLAPDDNGLGECALRPIESSSSTQEEDTSNKIVSPTPAPPAPRSASSEDLPSDASSSEDTDSQDDESNQSPPAAVM